MRTSTRLLVFLRLSHDFLSGEIDVAGRESIADEKIVGLGGVVILSVLEVGVFGSSERQFDRLRDDLPLERGDRGLDRNRDLAWPGAARGAQQSLARKLAAELAEAVLSFAAERRHRVLRVEHRLHDAGVAALRGKPVEMLLHRDRVGSYLLGGR